MIHRAGDYLVILMEQGVKHFGVGRRLEFSDSVSTYLLRAMTASYMIAHMATTMVIIIPFSFSKCALWCVL